MPPCNPRRLCGLCHVAAVRFQHRCDVARLEGLDDAQARHGSGRFCARPLSMSSPAGGAACNAVGGCYVHCGASSVMPSPSSPRVSQRATALRSCRTLPGHSARSHAASRSAGTLALGPPSSLQKCATSTRTSPRSCVAAGAPRARRPTHDRGHRESVLLGFARSRSRRVAARRRTSI